MLRTAISKLVSPATSAARSRAARSLLPAALTPCGRAFTTTTPSSSYTYDFLKTEKRGEKGGVGLIRLNRPRALNALCDELMAELGQAIQLYDADEGVGAIVITGSDKAFAAGADIAEMQKLSYMDCYMRNFLSESL